MSLSASSTGILIVAIRFPFLVALKDLTIRLLVNFMSPVFIRASRTSPSESVSSMALMFSVLVLTLGESTVCPATMFQVLFNFLYS